MTTKECTRCKKDKELGCFYKDKRQRSGVSPSCKECQWKYRQDSLIKKRQSEYMSTPEYKKRKSEYNKTEEQRLKKREYNKTPEARKKRKEYLSRPETRKRILEYGRKPEYKIKSKKTRLLTKYNLTIEDYEKMLLFQNGKCAICGLKMKRPCVDHCHETKKVRGILCSNCNFGIGYLKDNINNLKGAINYLKKYEK